MIFSNIKWGLLVCIVSTSICRDSQYSFRQKNSKKNVTQGSISSSYQNIDTLRQHTKDNLLNDLQKSIDEQVSYMHSSQTQNTYNVGADKAIGLGLDKMILDAEMVALGAGLIGGGVYVDINSRNKKSITPSPVSPTPDQQEGFWDTVEQDTVGLGEWLEEHTLGDLVSEAILWLIIKKFLGQSKTTLADHIKEIKENPKMLEDAINSNPKLRESVQGAIQDLANKGMERLNQQVNDFTKSQTGAMRQGEEGKEPVSERHSIGEK